MTNSYVAKLLKSVARSKRGATAIEYGLIAALVAVAIAAAVGTVGTNLTSKFDSVATKIGAPA